MMDTMFTTFFFAKLLFSEPRWGVCRLAAGGAGAVVTLWSIHELTAARKPLRGGLGAANLQVRPEGEGGEAGELTADKIGRLVVRRSGLKGDPG